MKVTLTHHETLCFARDRLQRLIGKDINLDFESSPPRDSNTRITSANKIELIRFARQFASDLFNNKLSPSIDSKDGHLYFGLAEAKKYVETHFGWTS